MNPFKPTISSGLKFKVGGDHPWERVFIFLRRINGKWIFCRHVYKGNPFWTSATLQGLPIIEYEYALDDFELIQKSSKP